MADVFFRRWRAFTPALLFGAMSALDTALQAENRTLLQEVFSHPLLDGCVASLTVLKMGAFWGGFAFILGRWSRILYLPLWGWICLVEVVEVFARIYYRMSLDGDWLMLVLASSSREMGEFFSGIGTCAIGLGVVAGLVTMAGGGFLLWKSTAVKVSLRSVSCGLAMMAPFLLWNLALCAPTTAFHDMMYTYLPVDTIHNWGIYSDVGKMASCPQLPKGLALDLAEGGRRPFGLFVIGESASRAHWHLYGYERPTTPQMESIRGELVVFHEVTATHPTTGKALRMLLTEATVDVPDAAKCSFPQELAAVGFRPALISAQSRWGRWEGVETLLFSGCGRKVYLDELNQDETREEGPFDGDLLPLLDAELLARDAPDMVFLHLQGSHAAPFYRYPQRRTIYPRYEGDFAPGVPKDDERLQGRMNSYDNSIVYTDCVLDELVQRLKGRKDASFLVYLSDHGETPRSDSWRNKDDPELFQVPFVVWFSPAYRRTFPEVVQAIEKMAREPLRLDRAKRVLRLLARLSVGDS